MWPTALEQGKTALGQFYEVSFENGVKVLNSKNTNYSFGSLHQIMLKGIDEVLRTCKPESILMLGLGAGSAVSILKQKCKHPYRLTAVEIDSDLIELSRKHFGLGSEDVEIVHDDAQAAVMRLPEKAFDLIIDDVFWDNSVPEFCSHIDYLSGNKRLLKPGGIYMRNIMAESLKDVKSYENQLAQVFAEFYSVTHKTYGNKIYFCKA